MEKLNTQELEDFLESICVTQGIFDTSQLKVHVIDPKLPGNINDGRYMFTISDEKHHTLVSINYDEDRSVTNVKFRVKNTIKPFEYKQIVGEYCSKAAIGMITSVQIKLKGLPVERIEEIILNNAEALHLA